MPVTFPYLSLPLPSINLSFIIANHPNGLNVKHRDIDSTNLPEEFLFFI